MNNSVVKVLRDPLRVTRALAARVPFPGRDHYCVLCERRVSAFLPFRRGLRDCAPLMLELQVIGGDPEQCACPWCGCTDRERHLLLYLRATGLLERFSQARVLHMAPERLLSQLLSDNNEGHYVRVDLARGLNVDLQADLSRLPFATASFDILLANHVLEHVTDLDESLAEIARVVKPGGFAILQTPYSPLLSGTLSDPGISTDKARFHAFGQEDHVRLFGRDIFDLIAAHGFTADVRQHEDALGALSDRNYGVNTAEPLFLFLRN